DAQRAVARRAPPLRGAQSARHAAAHGVPREDLESEPRSAGAARPGVRAPGPLHKGGSMSESLLIGRPSDAALGDQLLGTTWRAGGTGWKIAFAITGALTALLIALITYTVVIGIGVWGVNIPVGWAFAIINFVWWIGIGHAGTFISAILYLF